MDWNLFVLAANCANYTNQKWVEFAADFFDRNDLIFVFKYSSLIGSNDTIIE